MPFTPHLYFTIQVKRMHSSGLNRKGESRRQQANPVVHLKKWPLQRCVCTCVYEFCDCMWREKLK